MGMKKSKKFVVVLVLLLTVCVAMPATAFAGNLPAAGGSQTGGGVTGASDGGVVDPAGGGSGDGLSGSGGSGGSGDRASATLALQGAQARTLSWELTDAATGKTVLSGKGEPADLTPAKTLGLRGRYHFTWHIVDTAGFTITVDRDLNFQ